MPRSTARAAAGKLRGGPGGHGSAQLHLGGIRPRRRGDCQPDLQERHEQLSRSGVGSSLELFAGRQRPRQCDCRNPQEQIPGKHLRLHSWRPGEEGQVFFFASYQWDNYRSSATGGDLILPFGGRLWRASAVCLQPAHCCGDAGGLWPAARRSDAFGRSSADSAWGPTL
jgi:hypothetical protein